jgi:ribonuclease T2
MSRSSQLSSKSKTAFVLSFALTIALTACKSNAPTSETPPAPSQPDIQPDVPEIKAELPPANPNFGKPFDFYLLTLSWSPEYCATNPGSQECAGHPGFVVHGLWPQNDNGTYPQNCGSRPGPTSDAVWQGVLPTQALAVHEWLTHGVCTPYDADTYFGLIRKAFGEVQIPPAFTNTTQQTMEPPASIIAQFASINTGFPPGGIAVSCGNNRLTAMQFCLDKNLNPIACSGVKTCRANVVKVTPQ